MKKSYLLLITIACCSVFIISKTFTKQKVLLNAEPFGFGPSAAITELFPYLRKQIDHLSYIGTGHTLDLQRTLPYDAVYDYGDNGYDQQKAQFNGIAKSYTVFITASNYEAAQWAKDLGLQLIIYDPLTWYWPKVPHIVTQADLYIAQNFFGVSQRITNEPENFPESVIVSPLVPYLTKEKIKKTHDSILVNMGGLSNPFISDDDLIIFAKMVLSSVHEVFESQFDTIDCATSRTIANATHDLYHTQTLQPQEIQNILENSTLAIMTSGLGNIYEVSNLKKFVIWLPPTNDSQGQQVKLLEKHTMLDFAIDWHEIFENETPIDYFAPQEEVLQQIANYIQKIPNNSQVKCKFKILLQDAFDRIQAHPLATPALAKLTDFFGTDGAQQATQAILKKLNEFEMKYFQ